MNCNHNWIEIGSDSSSCHDVWYYECSICDSKLTKGGSIDGDIYELKSKR